MAISTNVPAPQWTDAGFIIPQATDILTGVLQDINAAFGGDLNPALDTPQGQLASSEAAVINFVNQIFLKYTQQVDPAFATGRMQDAIARIYFLERNPSQPTVVACNCNGLAGVIITTGAIAIAEDGNQYVCTGGGTIPVSGTISLNFACAIDGPIVCPPDALNQIYRAIPGWDSINNPDAGVIGNNVESRSEFEQRRAASVAQNSNGSLPSIKGAVLAVPDVIDAYVTENDLNTVQTIGGVSLYPNSIYVAVIGGDAQAIAQAIWSRKAPGCAYNGNTTETVLDTSVGYVPPYPSYSVSFEIPAPLEILFAVNIASSSLVPADAALQIQNAIIAAFAGTDGGLRASIGTTIFALRYVAPIMALGTWAQIISIEIGSLNAEAAAFTATIAGTNMTVSAVASGALAAGQTIIDPLGNVSAGTQIVSQTSGSAGGTGVYVVSNSQTVSTQPMQTAVADLFDIDVNINQVPVIAAANIFVTVT